MKISTLSYALIIIIITLLIGTLWWTNQSPQIITDKLSTTPPIQISDATLNLSGQGLTKAPLSVFGRSEIEELNLSNNNIDGSLQSQVGNLKNLKVLNLSNNKFSGVPAEIGQLQKLEVLDLSNNLITGLPNELRNLKNLKLLDLSRNNYSLEDLEIIKAGLPASTVIKTK